MKRIQQSLGLKGILALSMIIIWVGIFTWYTYRSKHHLLDEMKQSMLTPEQVIQDLMAGNKRFCSSAKKQRPSLLGLSQKASAQGQYPKAVILACMDSRSIPEIIFDQSIGDIFTLRVAGNIINDDMLASLEYATKYSGSKVILIMGHTQCGAIKAACSGTASGNIKSLVRAIDPAVETVKHHHPHEQFDCANNVTITEIAQENVHNMIAHIIKDSAAIQKLLKEGTIKIIGAMHNLETGVVDFFEKM